MFRRILLVLSVAAVMAAMVAVMAVPAFAQPGLPGNVKFGLPAGLWNNWGGGGNGDADDDGARLVCDIDDDGDLEDCRMVD